MTDKEIIEEGVVSKVSNLVDKFYKKYDFEMMVTDLLAKRIFDEKFTDERINEILHSEDFKNALAEKMIEAISTL